MSGFKFHSSLIGTEQPALQYLTIANSSTITIGDMVYADSDGFATVATAGSVVLGVVVGVSDANGIDVTPDSGTLDNYTVASDNETVAKKKVAIDTSPFNIYKIDTSGTFAQTNLYQFFDLTSEAVVNTSSASDSAGQLQLVGFDSEDTSIGYFRIAESQLYPFAQQ